ncbi:MAG TPA: FtsX-like permease family protein [Rhodanobacteraceae bacterium]|nr:FtsX-like permease family protein [Rhodanobacteraceae bacterium]
MQIQPILATLRRHKLIAGLLALLVAFTCAIVCNVAFMIARHATAMHVISGVDENRLVTVESVDLAHGVNRLAQDQADLAALRAIPGVESAVVVDALPFNGNNWTTSASITADGSSVANIRVFNGSPGELQTLGLKLIAGRDFRADEYVPKQGAHGDSGLKHVPAVIVTQQLAERLFPGQSALGKAIYPYKEPVRIVGVVAHLLNPDAGDGADSNFSALFPMLPGDPDVTYVLRTQPQDRARVLKQATALLTRLDPNRVLRRPQTFAQMRADYFQGDRTMMSLLIASALGLLFVAALGITGLANFWVQQRTRSIGIRRAVGATRADILHYFQVENFLIVTWGVVLGAILAVGVNLLLMHFYELPRLPLWYLLVGAAALWVLGQLAVLSPARRASRVPPVVATRSV